MKNLLIVVALIAALGGCASDSGLSVGSEGVMAQPGVGDGVLAMVLQGREEVETFFEGPFKGPFEVREFKTSAEMAEFAKDKWGVEELPCWAVAMGSGSGLVLLDPEVWKTEACDHAEEDGVTVQRIVTHELVHVYHGQRNPDHEFERSDELGWFIEGLAVFASGQLDEARLRQAREVVAAGRGPRKLAEAWSGKARYAVAGTMVQFVDAKVGRSEVVRLMKAGKTEEVLKSVGMSEDEFIAAWEEWVTG